MSLLQQENVLFYHPLDSRTEFLQSINWTNQANTFVNALVISGIQHSGSSTTSRIYSPTNDDYTDLNGANSATMLVWSSGFWDNASDDARIVVGFGDAALSPRNNLMIRTITGLKIAQTNMKAVEVGLLEITSYPSSGWNLSVLDLRNEGGTIWRFRISFSGADWTDLGTFDADIFSGFDSDDRATIELERFSSSDTKFTADEVVLWKDSTLFTSDELNTLYNLALSGLSMNSYGAEVSTDQIDLFIDGIDDINDSLNLFISTLSSTSDYTDLFIYGIDSFSDSITLHIGVFTINDNLNLFIHGKDFEDNDFDLFIHGIYTQSWDLFAKIEDTTTVNELNLFTYGSSTPSSGSILHDNSINLFIESIEQVESASGSWGLFARTVDPFLVPTSGDFILFARVGGTINDNIDLNIYGHASGSSPNGILTSGEIDLFVQGDGDSINENFVAYSNFWGIFAKVESGLNNSIDLFIDGFSFPSGEIDLNIFGIIDTEQNNADLFINGNESSVFNNINITINGILGIISNDITLFIFTDMAEEDSSFTLYIHGF